MDRGFGASGRVFGVSLVSLAAVVISLALTLSAASTEDRPLEPQVVGGNAVPDGKYPFMASMQSDRVQTTRGHFCGGTLIDEDSILTAAHCARVIGSSNTSSKIDYESVRIVVGRTVLTGGGGEVRGIARLSDVRVHPQYRSNSPAYDVAVIKLDSPVTDIAPINLATAADNDLEEPGNSVTVAGWGSTIAQNAQYTKPSNTTDRMREANVPVISDAKAKRKYSGRVPYSSPLMVAAGREGTDTCQGDSGGPLFDGTGSGTVQVGITSTGIGCAIKRYPGIYTEVNAPSIQNFIAGASS